MTDRKADLDAALHNFSQKSFIRLGETVPTLSVIPSGSIALDRCLGTGGYPRGRIIEIYGPESSGKTTLALHALATTQREGGQAVLIDTDNSFNPEYAERVGVNNDDLLLSQPETGEQALELAETLIRSGTVDLLVIDSIAAITPQAEVEGSMGESHAGSQSQIISNALRRFAGAIKKSKAVVIFVNQIRSRPGYRKFETTPGGRALKFYASIRLDVRNAGTIRQNNDVIGNHVKIEIVKNKIAQSTGICEVDMMYGEGISHEGSLLDIAVDEEIVIKNGTWYSYEDIQLGQGREATKQFLKANPHLIATIQKRLEVKE